jgi:D-alanine-D-alanine ligase
MRTIGIITGGEDGERVISLKSAACVEKSLRSSSSAEVITYDMPGDWQSLEADLAQQVFDFVFVMIHGKGGEDGEIVGILDLYEVPHQCAPREVLALTLNKRTTKQVWRGTWLPVAKDMLVSPQELTLPSTMPAIEEHIWFPCVVKVLTQWSSNGVHVVTDAEQLEHTLAQYIQSTAPVLIEAFLAGDEVTVGILEQSDGTAVALPVTLILPPEGGFDFANKYNGKTQELCPAPLEQTIVEQCQNIALHAYHAVGGRKYARVDMIITSDGPILLEINTIPGFTEQSLFPKAAQVAWLPFPKLLEHLMEVWGATSTR